MATVAVSALALTGRVASHRAAGVSDGETPSHRSLGAGVSHHRGWRDRTWRPSADPLAAAMRADPKYHRYLPKIYPGFDMSSDDWYHRPREDTVPSSLGDATTTERERDFDLPGLPPRSVTHGGERGAKVKNQFKVCLDNGAGSWDKAFARGIDNLFTPGVCFGEVVERSCADADVVIFNEHDFIWGGAHRDPATHAIELPPKAHENQVYMYFAHEAAGGFGSELRDSKFTKQFDYLSYVDRTRSAMWWPFGPTLRTLTDDFDVFGKSRAARVPGIAWLATDCVEPRASMVTAIADEFPVFSMGECLRNSPTPHGLPQRGAVDPSSHGAFQSAMSDYMFYFAVENAGACEGYATEKVWMALSRGSVPLYFGTDDVYDTLPDPHAIVDLRKFTSIAQLAARLRAIATDPKEWRKVHAWRYRDPASWPVGFRELIRATSTDVKYGVCDVLMKGPRGYARSEGRRQARCETRMEVLGKTLGKAGWGAEEYVGRSSKTKVMTPPTTHLERRCEETSGKCWSLRSEGRG